MEVKRMNENNEVSIESQQSVEISINAKGQYSGKVKVYATTIDDAYNQALLKAAQLEELIKKKNE